MSSPVLLYQPDKGASYGQAPRARRIVDVWEDLQLFLATAVVAQPPKFVSLTAYRATQWDDEQIADTCIARTRDAFGAPDAEESHGGHLWPSGEPVAGGHLRWHLAADAIVQAVNFLAAGEPWPKQTLGPVELRLSYSFQWRNPPADAVRIEVPESNIGVTLARRSLIQPTLWFPIALDDPQLSPWLSSVAPHLPMRLLARHFRAAEFRRDGTFRVRKLAKPPLAAT